MFCFSYSITLNFFLIYFGRQAKCNLLFSNRFLNLDYVPKRWRPKYLFLYLICYFYFQDGHDYDPTDFDFHKVDAEEARKDSVAQKEGFDPNQFSSKINL